MLNRSKLYTQFNQHITNHRHHGKDYDAPTRTLWNTLINQAPLWHEVTAIARTREQPWCTTWHTIPPQLDERISHHVVAVDGSQIFPQPHRGIHWYLMNIGICHFNYQGPTSTAHLTAEPLLVEPHTSVTESDISLERTWQELIQGTAYAVQHNGPTLLLFDGILLPHFPTHMDRSAALSSLMQTWRTTLPYVAAYISMPQSRIITEFIAIAARILEVPYEYYPSDSFILSHILPPYHSTPLWHLDANVMCYFYHTGEEIVRIEMMSSPQNTEHISLMHPMIVNQIKLGYGYPLALAEAHAQATISPRDYAWFYQLIKHHSPTAVHTSQKQLRKQCIPL